MSEHRSNLSLFQLIDRKKFDALVLKHQMDKGVRSFTTWEFTQALLTCLVLRLGSFRDVEEALGIPHSTFGDALSLRFHGFYQDLCEEILLQIRHRSPSRKVRRAIREILAIDSSEIRVHGSIFSLAGWQLKQSDGHQGGCKLHTVFNVDGGWIEDFKITGVRQGDSPISLQLKLLPHKMYVFDRAYNDLDFWLKIINHQSDFVTRLKDCARMKEIQTEALKKVNPDRDGVLWDGFYVPCPAQMNLHRDQMEITQLRHIIYRDPETKKIFHFVTSDLNSLAQRIADIYKKRWAVELLFKWLKGHLDIRYLAVQNPNAVKTQLAAAVLLQLLLQLEKMSTDFKGTLWNMLRKIRTSLIRQILSASGCADGCRWSGPSINPTGACGL